MMATLRNRHPAKVAPIALSKGLCLNFFERIGSVPKNITIKKKLIITSIFSKSRTDESYIFVVFYIFNIGLFI